MSNMIKSYGWIDPSEVLLCAFEFVINDGSRQSISEFVDALVELSSEELNTHDGENQPEHKTDK